MSSNIYVGNLSYNMSDDELKNLFQEHGDVISAKIIKDKNTGRSKGFGFVEMSDDNAGDAAINKLNGANIKGRNLKVNPAKSKN